jgi:hypothetical protein
MDTPYTRFGSFWQRTFDDANKTIVGLNFNLDATEIGKFADDAFRGHRMASFLLG